MPGGSHSSSARARGEYWLNLRNSPSNSPVALQMLHPPQRGQNPWPRHPAQPSGPHQLQLRIRANTFDPGKPRILSLALE